MPEVREFKNVQVVSYAAGAWDVRLLNGDHEGFFSSHEWEFTATFVRKMPTIKVGNKVQLCIHDDVSDDDNPGHVIGTHNDRVWLYWEVDPDFVQEWAAEKLRVVG